MTLHRPITLLTSLAVCAALSACAPAASIRDKAPADVSTHIQTAVLTQRAPIQAAWWQAFRDPLMTALIQEALQANPDIKTAQANLRAARAQRAIAASGLLPVVSAGSSARRSGGGDSYTATLDASWEADIFGGKHLASRAAEADAQASQATLEDVKASLAAEVANAYVNMRLAQARLSVSRQSLNSRAETVRLTKLKEQAGLASGLEVEQANLSLGQAQAQIPALENSLTQSQYALATLAGKAPQALLTRLAASRPIPTAAAPLENHVPANAIRQRPDIRAAEYQVAAASLRVGEAKANLYPSFNLGGALSLSSLSLTDLLDASGIARSLLASISAPLFNGGSLRQQVVVKDAAREQAVASYQKAVLNALRDVANAFSSLQSLHRQQPLLMQNVQVARNAEQLAKLSYEAGTTDFQDVLDAQRNTLNARESLLAAQADNTLALIGLYKAVGGAW